MTQESIGVREVQINHGSDALTDSALLSVLLGAGNDSIDIGPLHLLPHRTVQELMTLAGMSEVKARRLLAALELGRRAFVAPPSGPVVCSPEAVAQACAALAMLGHEEFWAVQVNNRNMITRTLVIAKGWESGVNLTPLRVFQALCKEGVTRVLFVHNHPSGDPSASPEDVRFTRKLLDAARALEIKVLDHIVVARGAGFCSLRSAGYPDLEWS